MSGGEKVFFGGEKVFLVVGKFFFPCLNCSSKVHEPLPMSWLPVDWGVGGWEGLPWEKLGMLMGEPGRLARKELVLPACLRSASRAGRP